MQVKFGQVLQFQKSLLSCCNFGGYYRLDASVNPLSVLLIPFCLAQIQLNLSSFPHHLTHKYHPKMGMQKLSCLSKKFKKEQISQKIKIWHLLAYKVYKMGQWECKGVPALTPGVQKPVPCSPRTALIGSENFPF